MAFRFVGTKCLQLSENGSLRINIVGRYKILCAIRSLSEKIYNTENKRCPFAQVDK